MKMVIGGAYQGQLDWAKQTFPEVKEWVDGADCLPEQIYTCDGIYDFHEYIKRLPEGDLAQKLIERNPNLVIVTDEIGYGLVPVDAGERAYRERVGRVCTELAAYSEQVIRVVMGIGTYIKEQK